MPTYAIRVILLKATRRNLSLPYTYLETNITLCCRRCGGVWLWLPSSNPWPD